jgi:hypothetical protein
LCIAKGKKTLGAVLRPTKESTAKAAQPLSDAEISGGKVKDYEDHTYQKASA